MREIREIVAKLVDLANRLIAPHSRPVPVPVRVPVNNRSPRRR